MANKRLFVSAQKNSSAQGPFEQGFALISLLALVPLLMTLLTALGAAAIVLKRKSLAQSQCLQIAARLEQNLIQPLENLLQLNPRAEILRKRRFAADKSLQTAIGTGNPVLIASAHATQTAVILEQTELHAEQLTLLATAENAKAEGQRQFYAMARKLRVSKTQILNFYPQALALTPNPPDSLSPNYEPVRDFDTAQQQRFRFLIDLAIDFPIADLIVAETKQKTECAVTIKKELSKWKLQILTAKAF